MRTLMILVLASMASMASAQSNGWWERTQDTWSGQPSWMPTPRQPDRRNERTTTTHQWNGGRMESTTRDGRNNTIQRCTTEFRGGVAHTVCR